MHIAYRTILVCQVTLFSFPPPPINRRIFRQARKICTFFFHKLRLMSIYRFVLATILNFARVLKSSKTINYKGSVDIDTVC